MKKTALAVFLFTLVLSAAAEFKIDPSVMSDAYWAIWNDAEQAKIDADIERNRKADFTVEIGGAAGVPAGTEVTVEQIGHDFRFGAHIFNYDQLGKKEYNDAYKASYGEGGIFNQATVAFYWKEYEPLPGRFRAFGDYEDTARFWNSLTRDEAMEHPFWRRPAPAPVIDYLKSRSVAIHGHILIWGSAKPDWIYDWYCPEEEKRAFDALGIPRHDAKCPPTASWSGSYNKFWKQRWGVAYRKTGVTEKSVAAMAPTFTKRMPELFRKRVFDVAREFGEVVDSWDVVNESSHDWTRYRKSRSGLPVWFSRYGLMPGDYPLHALLDAKEAFPAKANLAINDFNISDDFLAQVKDLEGEGAKIDIVGCQMHIFVTNDCMRLAEGAKNVNWVGTPETIQSRLDMMAKTGKRLHVSEITITSPGADDRSRMIQAVLTRNIYRKWFSHRALMGITWWNTVDGGGVKGEPLVSGLFTRDLKKKPAYLALDQLINHEWKTKAKVKVRGEGKGEGRTVSFRGFRGKYRLSWKCPSCGETHAREMWLRESDRNVVVPPCEDEVRNKPLRRYTVDGKPASPAADETTLELARIYPKDAVNGEEGMRWAEVAVTVVAPADGTYRLLRVNDYFGSLTVNGTDCGGANGSFDVNDPFPFSVNLRKGENRLVLRTRAGTGGSWRVGFFLPPDSPLKEK